MRKAFTKALYETLEISESSELAYTWSYGFGRLRDEFIHIKDLIRKHSTAPVAQSA